MYAETLAGKQSLQQGDVASAISVLEQAAQRYPQDFDTHLFLGGAYSQAGRYHDAIRALTQAVNIQPSSPQARYNLGVTLYQAGWKEQAITAVEQALQLKPDYAQAQQALNGFRQSVTPNIGAAGMALPNQAVVQTQPVYTPPAQQQAPSLYSPASQPTLTFLILCCQYLVSPHYFSAAICFIGR